MELGFHYLNLPYHLEVRKDETDDGPYWASRVAELPGCLGDGESPEEALTSVQESMRLWLSVALDKGRPIPEPAVETEYSGQFRLRLPSTVHRDLARRASREGVSRNAWAMTVLAKYGT